MAAKTKLGVNLVVPGSTKDRDSTKGSTTALLSIKGPPRDPISTRGQVQPIVVVQIQVSTRAQTTTKGQVGSATTTMATQLPLHPALMLSSMQVLTTETTTTLPPLVVALVDVVAGQTGKASEGSSHEKVMEEGGAMWWTAPPFLPCPDEDLVQWVLNLQKQPLRERGVTKVVKIFGLRCLTGFFWDFVPNYG